jgi:hypothetical protein
LYTFLYKYCWQYLYTSIAIIHFKRSHIENNFRQLDKFTFNLSIFFNEMFSLQNPFSNWIVNIRLSIIYLLYACRVQSVVPPLICIHYTLCYFNICIIISIIACHMTFLHGFVEIKTIKLITSLSCQIFVLPSTGFEFTPLIHCSINRLALCPAP